MPVNILLFKATKDPLLKHSLALFLVFFLLLDIYDQGKGNGAIGHKTPEVFPQSGIVEKVLARLGRNYEKSMKEKNPGECVPYFRAFDAGAASQKGSAGNNIHIQMCRIDIEHADILQVGQLPESSQNGGQDNYLDPEQIHIDSGKFSLLTAGTHRLHLLAKAGMQKVVEYPRKQENHQDHE